MTNNLYLDINVLQTVPSSNLNRDDAGSPKTAIYGGVTRARVSSQSWKRAIRLAFNADDHSDTPAGIRTKDAVKLLTEEIQRQDAGIADDVAAAKARDLINAAGIKTDKSDQTGALLLISRGQVEKLAQYALAHDQYEDKKALKAALKADQSLDTALFGRMVADDPELNVDASAQVAHAVSTHEIVPEFDYFTALDDLQPEDSSGAAMLGTIEYNSSTLYRYANLNLHELRHNIGDAATIQGALRFIKSFLLSMPTGKQNTFANKTLPNYVMIALRRDTPVNLVSAFEEPVHAGTEGYVKGSIKRLKQAAQDALQYVEAPLLAVTMTAYASEATDRVANLTDLLAQVEAALEKVAQDENAGD
ncbi:type I-E CRISPR-associated protein Cas7/Cse4/CasC [Lacticaseibacillus absianus]|uniref:type I-E CRISPR-associated protein Cas7/Cse4/CasC n=1 Tax=Lacticaseibacillus absianus TaxID=2729623 RepID=UPI0015C88FB0|nr:type I-E CRISPR-associated protein Cas7/Cse4/CasC [Lacticaseibacillus absianus]